MLTRLQDKGCRCIMLQLPTRLQDHLQRWMGRPAGTPNARKDFFDFGKEIDHDTLDISSEFIRERTEYRGPELGELRPAPPTVENMAAAKTPEDIVKFGKAIVCPNCYACISKTKWNSWECMTADCGFIHTVVTPTIGIDEALLHSKKVIGSMISHHPDVKLSQVKFGAYQVDIYELPDLEGKPAGFVAHLKSNDVINQQLGGPDEIFKQMQTDMHGVKRGISRGGEGGKSFIAFVILEPELSQTGTTQTLTNHYATNWVRSILITLLLFANSFSGCTIQVACQAAINLICGQPGFSDHYAESIGVCWQQGNRVWQPDP